MFTIIQICHFVTCFILCLSLLIGLIRKEEKQIRFWHMINRICLAIMAIGGLIMEIRVLPNHLISGLIKCLLGFITIILMEKTFTYKEEGSLNRKNIFILLIFYALTVICGLVLLKMTGGFGGL